MLKEFKKGHASMRFDSFGEAIKFSNTHKEQSEAATHDSNNKRGYYASDWHGTKTFQEAVTLASTGYPKGRKQIETFKAVLDGRLESTHLNRQEVCFDVVGSGGFDIGTVLTGVPECAIEWMDTQVKDEKQSRHGKVIKFLVNLTASAMVNANVLATRGAVVGALVDCLEQEGYSVEVESVVTVDVNSYSKANGVIDIRVPIKSAGEMLQLDQLAYALVCVGFFRRIGFVHIAMAGDIGMTAREASYGVPRDIDGDQLTQEQVDLYFPMAHGHEPQWSSNDGAIKWIAEQLQLFGINVESVKR